MVLLDQLQHLTQCVLLLIVLLRNTLTPIQYKLIQRLGNILRREGVVDRILELSRMNGSGLEKGMKPTPSSSLPFLHL